VAGMLAAAARTLGSSRLNGVVKQIQSDIESTINKAQFTLMLEDPQQCDLVLKTP
jgi:hypothetical protein